MRFDQVGILTYEPCQQNEGSECDLRLYAKVKICITRDLRCKMDTLKSRTLHTYRSIS